MSSINKWLASVNQVVVFKTKVLHFEIENTSIKVAYGKRKFKRMLDSFLWTNESFSLWNCLSRNSTLFSSQRRAWLVLSQSRQRGFWRNLRYILYSVVKKSSFLKGNFHGCFLHFDFGVKGKPQNLPDLKLILCCIMPCAQPMWLAWTYPQSS